LVFGHLDVYATLEKLAGLLTTLGGCHVGVACERGVVGVLALEQDPADGVGQAWWAFALGNFSEELLLLFLVHHDLDLAEISFLSVSPSLGMIPDIEIPSGLANQAPMHPQPHRVIPPLLGMIQKIPKRPHHQLSHLFMAAHQRVNCIQHIKSLDRVHCVFGSIFIS
jgi:hypothetical protein